MGRPGVPAESGGGGAESASLVLSAVSPRRGGRPGRPLGFRATCVCNLDPFFCSAAGKEAPVLRGLAARLSPSGCSLS